VLAQVRSGSWSSTFFEEVEEAWFGRRNARCVFVIDITQQHIAIVDSLRGVVEPLRNEQPLESVTADASAERNEYHKLALNQLDKLDDAEALYQIGDRIMHGIGIEEDKKLGLGIMIEAARRGHAVALGVCFLRGRGIKRNDARAFELIRASADRGHASGARTNSHSIFKLDSHDHSQLNTAWAIATSKAVELMWTNRKPFACIALRCCRAMRQLNTGWASVIKMEMALKRTN
jgi:hypothetical protein